MSWRPCDETNDSTVLRALCALTFALLVCTWRLWRGQTAFPQVPLFAFAVSWPLVLDHLLAVVLSVAMLSAAALASCRRSRRVAVVTALVCLAFLWTTDQHRLQPWAYHFAVAAWILVACPAPQNLRWLRLLTVSVYAFSAFSKLDAKFLHTNGVLFIEAFLQTVGRSVEPAARDRLAVWALLFPLGELVTAVLLAVRGLRLAGLVSAVVLHVSLIGLLGPWGLDHRYGVLVWNVSFLTQTLLLFGPSALNRWQHASAPAARWLPSSWSARVAMIPVVGVLTLPSLEPLGLWDAWLSWGLYSSRAAKVEIYLSHDAVRELPESIQAFCDPRRPTDIWTRLAIDRWSLETLQTPLYPHERFELGVGLAVHDLLPQDVRHMMVVRSSSPNRWSGVSEKTRWKETDELYRRAKLYRWNSLPRSAFASQ